MSERADVVIVGGGIMGLSIAFQLAQRGAGRVLVLEKRVVGAGSSGKSGAILRQHYSHATTVRMARESLGFYASFQETYGRDIGFRRSGMIFLCHAEDRAALEANVALQRGLGVEVETLEAPDLRELEPRAVFGDEVIGALEPEAGFVDPRRTLAALRELCAEHRVDVREGVRVTDVRVDGGPVVRGVEVDGAARIDAPVVVNAAGPWAARLCERLGVDVPLRAIRPEQAYFAPPPGDPAERHVYGDLLTGLYWKPEAAGWTRVGKMAYDGDADVPDPDDYDEGVSHAFIADCRRRLADRLPRYRDAISWGGCAALYTVTPDAHALIGPVPGVDGLFVCSGFSGHGFKMGPAVGRGVAGLVTGTDPGPLDPDFFAVDRFARGAPVGTAYRYGILG